MTRHWHVQVSSGLTLLIGDDEEARAEHKRLTGIFGEQVKLSECEAIHTITRGNSRRRRSLDDPPAPPPA